MESGAFPPFAGTKVKDVFRLVANFGSADDKRSERETETSASGSADYASAVGNPAFSRVLFGANLGIALCGGSWLSDGGVQALPPVR